MGFWNPVDYKGGIYNGGLKELCNCRNALLMHLCTDWPQWPSDHSLPTCFTSHNHARQTAFRNCASDLSEAHHVFTEDPKGLTQEPMARAFATERFSGWVSCRRCFHVWKEIELLSLLPCLSLRALQCNNQQITMQCLGQCGCGVLASAHVLSLVSAQARALES